jgi:enamine deaminase RidA (YjgF/YER057c/UK114 family)
MGSLDIKHDKNISFYSTSHQLGNCGGRSVLPEGWRRPTRPMAPARAAVPVPALHFGLKIEIEAIALA